MRMHVRSGSVVILLGMILLAGLVVLPATAGSFMMFHMNPQHTGDYSSVSNGILPDDQLKWTFPTGGPMDSSPAVVDGVVYLGSYDTNVYALDAESGIKKWEYLTGGYAVESSPAVVDDVVYVGTNDGAIYAIKAYDGNLKWRSHVGTYGSYLTSSPVVAGGVVYVGYYNGAVYAFNADDGSIKWGVMAGSGVTSSPAVADGVVYVGSWDGKVYAIDAVSGSQKWAFSTGAPVESSPAVVDGVVYVGSDDGNVYAINVDGSFKWAFYTGSPVHSSPAVVGGVVYVGCMNGDVYAIGTVSHGPIWVNHIGGPVESSPAVADGVVYVGSDDNKVYAIYAQDGNLRWYFDTGGAVTSSPAVADGVVYVGSDDGKIYAIGKTPPTFESIDPISGTQGEFVYVSLTGSNFASSTTVKFSKAGSPDMPLLVVPPVMPMYIGGGLFIPADAAAGDRDIVITIPYGGQVTAPGEFTVIASPPFFSSITPNSGAQGATLPVTITGNFFVSGATVKFQRYGSPEMPLVIDTVTTTTITGTLSIPPGAATGEWHILITNPDGKSSVTPFGAFTVTSTGIKVTGITPNYAAAGTTVFISDLAGSGFKAGATVQLTRYGADSITATNGILVSPTKITCNFDIPSTAVTGMYTVVVTNIDSSSDQLTDGFEVRPPILVTSITPNYAAAGTTVFISDLAGSRFQDGAYVQLIRVGSISMTANVVSISPTKITCYFGIPSDQVIGMYTVLVRNPDGTYGELIDGFEVRNPAPSFTSIMPASGVVGATVPVTITGANFVSGATVAFKSGTASLSLAGVTVPQPSTITGSLSIPLGTATGVWDILITNPDGQSVTRTGVFTITSTGITVTGITPNSGAVGSTASITNLAGTGFQTGATVQLTKGAASIPATSINVASPRKIKCNFAIPSNAVLGMYTVVVKNPDGTSAQLTKGFTVTNPPPTVTSISPDTGVTGTTVTITSLTGTGFMQGAAVTLSGNGHVTYSGNYVGVSSSGTTITCTITLTGAKGGNYDVVVTNPDGSSDMLKNGFRVTKK